MTKTPEMQNALDRLAAEMFGRTYSQSITDHVCVICGQKVKRFRDVLSLKEYSISGMCQDCQDSVFGE